MRGVVLGVAKVIEVGERLSFQHWSKPFRGAASDQRLCLDYLASWGFAFAKTENGNVFTVTAGQRQTENGIIFWTNRNAELCMRKQKTVTDLLSDSGPGSNRKQYYFLDKQELGWAKTP